MTDSPEIDLDEIEADWREIVDFSRSNNRISKHLRTALKLISALRKSQERIEDAEQALHIIKNSRVYGEIANNYFTKWEKK